MKLFFGLVMLAATAIAAATDSRRHHCISVDEKKLQGSDSITEKFTQDACAASGGKLNSRKGIQMCCLTPRPTEFTNACNKYRAVDFDNAKLHGEDFPCECPGTTRSAC